MLYEVFNMPVYPCKKDMWDALCEESRPIVVYGMGNGADKLIRRFEKYGIEISDFFASDGFVRGHSFHGKRVKSFSEIKEAYSDFVIVLSFASGRKDVIDLLAQMDREYDMYIPDMPVAGEDEYFDKEFYNENYEKISDAYGRLADESSRQIFASIINYKLFGKMKYLMAAVTEKDEMYALLPCVSIELAIDAGAYNGDTVREMKEYFQNLKEVVAIEPDKRNFSKLVKYSEAESELTVKPLRCAVWNNDGLGGFNDSGNRNSSVSSTVSYQHKDTEIEFVRIDALTDEKVDYIKYDVEGAEREAFEGSGRLIEEYHPAILLSVYHRSRDIFEFVNTVADEYPFYKIYLRRLKCVPAWELNLLLVAD